MARAELLEITYDNCSTWYLFYGKISVFFFQSSERLIDGRKTPDYALYSELFTPELARQIVLGKQARMENLMRLSLLINLQGCVMLAPGFVLRLEYGHKCRIVVKFFLPAFLSEYWLFHYGGCSERLPGITLKCLYTTVYTGLRLYL